MQKGIVITYASRQFRPHEVRYPTHEFELAAVILALKIWMRYLLGERFELYTNHTSLRYLFSQKKLNMRDFGIEYTPGKRNKVADALCRKHQNVVLAILTEWKDLEALGGCGMQLRFTTSSN